MISRKRSSLALTAILTFALHLVNIGPLHTTASATTGVITNEAQLLAIQNNLSETYTVGASFSVSETTSESYITGTFTGSLNGNGFTISGLTAPLFNVISGSISNINLSTTPGGITTAAQDNNTGILAGKLAQGGSVISVNVSGSISIVGGESTGGLIGQASNGSTISNSSASVQISDENSEQTGGLVGYLEQGGRISGSTSSGTVETKVYSWGTGGLVGYMGYGSEFAALVTNSASSSRVKSASGNAGGLIGVADGRDPSPTKPGCTITNSSASGLVESSGGSYVGGLIGQVFKKVTISNVYASGDVTASTSDFVGGLLGSLEEAALTYSYATGNVTGAAPVGGLIGESNGSTTNSRALGNVNSSAGPLIGNGTGQTGSAPTGTDLELLNTGTGQTAAWGQSQNINSGKPYIVALVNRGFYLVTTPQTAAPAAVSEAEAKAAAAVAAAKREAEVKTARADISKTLEKADNLTADSFAKADIAGVTKENIAEVQAEILALPAELRTDINQVLKVARKFEVVGKIASEQATTLPISAFVEVGLIPTDSKNKVALIAAIRRASADSRDSFADIKAVIAAEAARIQDRKDRLAAAINRLKAK